MGEAAVSMEQPQADTDEALMHRVCAGERRAYQMLVDRHASRFLAQAYRVMGNQAAAEDMVQEAFIKLWTNPSAFNAEKSRFSTWFYRVVLNRCLDEKRKKTPQQLPEHYDSEDSTKKSDEQLSQAQTMQRLHTALETLKENQATAIRLCYLEGLSNAEAADVMNMKVKALESLLVRARAKLRDILGQQDITASDMM